MDRWTGARPTLSWRVNKSRSNCSWCGWATPDAGLWWPFRTKNRKPFLKGTCGPFIISAECRTAWAMIIWNRPSSECWWDGSGRNKAALWPSAAIISLKVTSAPLGRVTKKGAWNTVLAMSDVIFWCPYRRWPPLKHWMLICWNNVIRTISARLKGNRRRSGPPGSKNSQRYDHCQPPMWSVVVNCRSVWPLTVRWSSRPIAIRCRPIKRPKP